MNVQNKTFEHRPISDLMAIVKNDFKRFDAEGLIDDGTLVKTIMYCNDKLGMHIRDIKQVAIPVNEFVAELPMDFEKLYYVCAVEATNTIMTTQRNPFDNSFDSDVIYEAELDRESLGCQDNYSITINRKTHTTIHTYNTWIPLSLKAAESMCHIDCPNKNLKGRYTVEIKNDQIHTPFRCGTLYLMYVGLMKNEEGEILFPFHPMITPYYEWSVKEKILSDMIFNSDAPNIAELYKFAQRERTKAWLDAFNFTTERNFGDAVKLQRKKELSWYATYFKYLQ